MGKKLAIRGHSTRGKEVIKLLEMMGGHATVINKISNETDKVFFISDNENCFYRKSIRFIPDSSNEIEEFNIFTIEEFLEKYPFKVGDKVVDCYGNSLIIKSMNWLDDLETMVYDFKDSVIVLAAEDIEFADDNKLSDTVDNSTEAKSCTVSLKAIEDSIDSVQFVQSGKIVAVRFNTQNYENEVELQLDDYEIEVRDGRTYAVKKKSKYPTTYGECCDILGVTVETLSDFIFKDFHLTVAHTFSNSNEYYINLFKRFFELKLCYDAYCKIAGEQMGLDKPWEPDWNDQRPKYTITVIGNQLIKHHSLSQNYILAFPSEELRDIFYENFKNEIEQCKELL